MQQLAHFISEKKKSIEFVVPEIEIIRDDTALLRKKILSITPDERRKLGINKSTLWYLKKNISSRDKVMIYDKVLKKLGNYENV